MNFSDLPRAVADSSYRIHVEWRYLERHIEDQTLPLKTTARLELEPWFQRGHVWTEDQQVRYVEAKLRGSVPHDIIRCNCVGWMGSYKGPYVLVDGLQRVTAARKFLAGDLRVYGHTVDELGGIGKLPNWVEFIWTVNNLKNERDWLRWYVEINSGGTPHTDDELNKVLERIR